MCTWEEANSKQLEPVSVLVRIKRMHEVQKPNCVLSMRLQEVQYHFIKLTLHKTKINDNSYIFNCVLKLEKIVLRVCARAHAPSCPKKVCMQESVCVVEARDHLRCHSTSAHVFDSKQGLSLSQKLPTRLDGLASKRQGSTSPQFPGTGITSAPHTCLFICASWGSNSGPPVWMASTLLTELPPLAQKDLNREYKSTLQAKRKEPQGGLF